MARSLSTMRVFQKTVLFSRIFSNIYIEMKEAASSSGQRMAQATFEIFDDNIFNLLKDDRHSLQSLTASAITLQKIKTRFLNSAHKATADQMSRAKPISRINLDTNRFSIISKAVYDTLHCQRKITDIVLEKH
eukprot:912250_1